MCSEEHRSSRLSQWSSLQNAAARLPPRELQFPASRRPETAADSSENSPFGPCLRLCSGSPEACPSVLPTRSPWSLPLSQAVTLQSPPAPPTSQAVLLRRVTRAGTVILPRAPSRGGRRRPQPPHHACPTAAPAFLIPTGDL